MYSTDDVQIRGSRIDGLGIFAVRTIPKGTQLLPYVGKCIRREEYAARREGIYCFGLDKDRVIDGASQWNPAAFFNHSCAPNCFSCVIDGAIWIVADRDIKAEEELTFNYGYPLENFQRHRCHCGAPNCAGYIVAEELFPELKRMRERGELPSD